MRLWWRRQTFRLRQLPSIWFFLIFICILCLIILVPNPFSARYRRIPIEQNVYWNSVDELWKAKEEVRLSFFQDFRCDIHKTLNKVFFI
jgi:hypothetical protein